MTSKTNKILTSLFLGGAFIMFGLAIPIIQDKINNKWRDEDSILNNAYQSEAKLGLANDNNDIANLLAALLNMETVLEEQGDTNKSKTTRKEIQDLMESYRKSADKNMCLCTIAVHIAVHNGESPSKALLKKWQSMSFEGLLHEQNNILKNYNKNSEIRFNERKELESKKIWLYSFAAFFYLSGTLMMMFRKEEK